MIERIEPMHPEVVRALRAMSGTERLRIAHEMWEAVRIHLGAYLAARHPQWSSKDIERHVASRLLGDSAGAASLPR